MPSISKIRFTNIIYDNKQKRFNDDIFILEGNNAAVLLENGGGKTVFIQCAIQAVIPHSDLGERKIKETLLLDNTCAHVAIEWILKDRPRKYCVTAVSLYKDSNGGLTSYRFINEYTADSTGSIESIPFSLETPDGLKRAASREEISEYYSKAKAASMPARTFDTINEYQAALSRDYGIIASEWRSQLAINKKEGGVEEFFDGCSTAGRLVDNLLIPSIEAVIAGEGEKGFAKTFENQRDTFKEYNRLTRLITESDTAADRLNAYVREYERLNKKQMEILTARKQAKGLRMLADKELSGLDMRCDELNRQKEAVERERAELFYKRNSLHVLIKKSELDIAERDLSEAEELFDRAKELYDEKASRKENIEIYSAEHRIKNWDARLQAVKEEIERLEENPDIAELREMYNKYAALLKGCYIGTEESIKKELTGFDVWIKKYTDEKGLLEDELEAVNKSLDDLRYSKSGLESEIKIYTGNIDELKRKIFTDIANDRAGDYLSQYNKRLTELERGMSALNAEVIGMDIRIAEIRKEQPDIQGRYNGANTELIKINERLKGTEDRMERLVTGLNADYKEFYNLRDSNFYSREKAIRDNFEAILFKAEKNKEDALLGERIKKRVSDSYEGSEYFTGAPELYDIIERFKNRYSFIQSGGQYVNQAAEALDIPADGILARFPFWHYAIVINGTDLESLKRELHARELSCPVLVLTRDKARELTEGESLDIDSVSPDFWASNLDREGFTAWKNLIKEQGKAAEELRFDAERELERVRTDANGIKTFFLDCPDEDYLQMGRDRLELESKMNEYRRLSEALKSELEEIENARKAAVERKSEFEREAAFINKNREHAQKILKLEEENKSRAGDIMRMAGQIEADERKAKAVKRRIADTEENIDSQKEDKQAADIKLALLHEKAWYKAVKDTEPDMSGDMPEDALTERLNGLERRLMDVSDNRRILEERQSNYKAGRDREEEVCKRLKKEAKYPLEQGFSYYEGIERELVSLDDRLPELRGNMDNRRNKSEKLRDIRIGKQAIYEEALRDFKVKYEDLYIFTQELNEAEEALKEEEAAITSRYSALERDLGSVERERGKANAAVNKLSEIDREFKYGNITDAEEYADAPNYSYNRLKCVQEMDARLQQAFEAMRAEEKSVNNARRTYCEHCRREISDIRNRDKLIELVERAGSYAELEEGRKAMTASLERAKMMTQAALAEREEKMYQFTNHLYTHVEKIAKELLLIPKKTRVRVGDGWREIFDISYNEWDEKEARMAIRSQINYILDRIENNTEFKTEDDTEDLTKIRAFIEKSLGTKQLLKKIIGSNEIRVKCRKVTNDNQVLSRLYTWEESEKWSGGERWSKNMALFLGIQNYIAEKTEPDLRAGKSKSCVLLDNPFGKASSEHVLNPVFFVAKELGFQVITVTAHAEGKFISDYFPIVYSLKLREAMGGKTSIVTKELAIKHAHFEDKDPIELDRLTAKEQLTLF